MSAQQAGFAEFYAQTRDDCLRAVFANIGDRQAAEDCVAEAFARAWASWRKVSAHPVPRALGDQDRAEPGRLVVAPPSPQGR